MDKVHKVYGLCTIMVRWVNMCLYIKWVEGEEDRVQSSETYLRFMFTGRQTCLG